MVFFPFFPIFFLFLTSPSLHAEVSSTPTKGNVEEVYSCDTHQLSVIAKLFTISPAKSWVCNLSRFILQPSPEERGIPLFQGAERVCAKSGEMLPWPGFSVVWSAADAMTRSEIWADALGPSQSLSSSQQSESSRHP